MTKREGIQHYVGNTDMVQWLTYSLLSSTFLFNELKLNRNFWCFCIILFTYKDTDLFYLYILYTCNKVLKVEKNTYDIIVIERKKKKKKPHQYAFHLNSIFVNILSYLSSRDHDILFLNSSIYIL